ncbi:hypothetical protein [Streptomyces sp. NPDC059455]|uniref:hypothetical protein n=1 Tax=Streptomyces sp. NPDC059455 TaxID=3346837 RepID=UPI0036BEBFC5
MADTPEVASALVLEHGMDCPTCRTSDRLCDTGQELLRIHNANRSDAAAPHTGAPGSARALRLLRQESETLDGP